MEIKKAPIGYLTKFYLAVCLTLLFFVVIRSSSKRQEETHALIEVMNDYLKPMDRVDANFRDAAVQKGNEILQEKLPSQRALLESITRRKGMMVSLDQDTDSPIYYRDTFDPPVGYTSVPFLIATFNNENLKSLYSIVTTEGKKNATISVPDYRKLTDVINSKIKGQPGKFYSCKVLTHSPDKISNTQVLTERVDTREQIRVRLKIDFHRSPGDYLMNTAAESTKEDIIVLPFLHYEIPQTSFADYVEYANKSRKVAGISYDGLLEQITANAEELEHYGAMELFAAESISDPENQNGSESFEVAGMVISYSLFYYLFPLIISCTIILIYRYVGGILADTTRAAAATGAELKRYILEELIPLPVGKNSCKTMLLLIFSFIPALAVGITLIIKAGKFGTDLIALYLIAAGLCFYMSRKLILALT